MSKNKQLIYSTKFRVEMRKDAQLWHRIIVLLIKLWKKHIKRLWFECQNRRFFPFTTFFNFFEFLLFYFVSFCCFSSSNAQSYVQTIHCYPLYSSLFLLYFYTFSSLLSSGVRNCATETMYSALNFIFVIGNDSSCLLTCLYREERDLFYLNYLKRNENRN